MPIPRDPRERKNWKDPESGIVYHFRYLLGSYQDRYVKLQDKTTEILKKYLPKARAETKRKHGVEEADHLKAIFARAMALAQEEMESAGAESIKIAREMIDIFLAGWEGKNVPEFPKAGNPSDYLTLNDVQKLTIILNGLLPELSGVTLEESKN